MPNFLKPRLFREQIFQKRDFFRNQNRDPQKIGKSLETEMSHSDKRTGSGRRRRHLTIFNVFHLFLSLHSNLHDIFYPDVYLALLFNKKPNNVFLVRISSWGQGGKCFNQGLGESNSVTRILRQWE